MSSLLNRDDRDATLRRLETLRPGATRHWGTMDAAQMLAHLSIAMECATGERASTQSLLGKIVTPFIRGLVFGEKPFARNGPTDPTYLVADPRDFETEKARLVRLVERFGQRGPLGAAGQIHPFFGTLSAEQWGRLTWKHVDHHLRQFGA
jgi:hypothetical protein